MPRRYTIIRAVVETAIKECQRVGYFFGELKPHMRQEKRKMTNCKSILKLVISIAVAGTGFIAQSAIAQQADDYQPALPDMSIYKAMLDVNKTQGWVQFGEYDNRQIVYFSTLQTMHCRLSEIRYSIDSEKLDQRFPLGKCNVEQPFNLPTEDNKYLMLELKKNKASTITVQVVWDDGSGSEIVTYRPCDNSGGSTCARIKKIDKPEFRLDGPTGSSQSR